ncbi:MAG: methyltransferase domain-containing protein [Proteobacteria bacterium]|nr:methyltransferase domain-containing protein [Pseudomonadota bacterium]
MAAPASRRSWRERWLGLRNALIASPRFQRWAAGFPLTRPIAHRNARALFDLVAGFVYSQVLAACVRLRVFDMLADGPRAICDLPPRLRLTEDATIRLLKAAAALNLAEQLPDGRFALGPLGAALRGNPSLVSMIEHHAMLYADLSDPVALLRGELESPQLKAFWAYAKNPDPAAAMSGEVRAYSALMADSQALVADEVLDAYPLKGRNRLLDMGGGEGVFLGAAAARYPALDLMLFDLPAVTARAQKRFEANGLGARAQVFPGDFFRDPLPTGADTVSLVRVLHDHDDDFALAILRKIHAALPKGGILLVAEPMSGTAGAAPAGDAYFGFYLAAMGSGRPRTVNEIADFLRQTGFSQVRSVATRTPMVIRVLVASA